MRNLIFQEKIVCSDHRNANLTSLQEAISVSNAANDITTNL